MAMTSGIRTSWIRAITSCLKDITSRPLDEGALVDGRQSSGHGAPSDDRDRDGTTMAAALRGSRDKPLSRRSRQTSRLDTRQQVTSARSG